MQLNGNVQGLIDLIGEGGSTVTVTPILQSGIEIMTITVDNTTYVIYAPEGGGSEVEVDPILPSGTKIATINVNGVDYDIYSTDYSGDISSLQTGLSTANSNITALQGRMSTAEGNITTLQSDMTAAEGDISTLQSGLSTANSNITTLQGRVTTAEGNITTLQSDMTAAEGDISTLQSGLSTANSNITALQGRVTTAEGNITTLQSDMTAAESIIGDGQLDIGNDLTDAVNEINQSLSHYKDFTVTLSANSYVSPFTHLGTQNINGNLDGHSNYKITSILLLGGNSTQMGTVVYKGEGTSGDYINVYGNAAISMTIRVNYIVI